MAQVETNFTARRWVDISGTKTAHLTSESIAIKDLSPKFSGNSTRKS